MNVEAAAQNLVGRPLLVFVDGERKPIGTITKVHVEGDGIYIAGKLDDGQKLPETEGRLFKEMHDED
jgi:hypothetical protein